MIGYYVHHVGRGHLNRALAITAELDVAVTGLSSLPRPEAWAGEWIQLPPDDAIARSERVARSDGADAHGRLHWVPIGDAGVRERTGSISRWITQARPELVIVDVSVEVALLVRLHGIRVITVALPGERGDEAHRLGFDISSVILAAWPDEAEGMISGLSPAARRRLHRVGAISRFGSRGDEAEVLRGVVRQTPQRRVIVLGGAGGGSFDSSALESARASTPGWNWTVLGGRAGRWVDDPWPAICSADVVVTHAGQNALADVAAAGRPAIVIPEDRPHAEQRSTAAVLQRGDRWPVIVRSHFPLTGWPELLERAFALDGKRWRSWNDGRGQRVAAEAIQRELTSGGPEVAP